MGVYGTNLEGFGAFEGGVNADKGAPLVSTSSDGETALLFGPAALREIQAGVANGDFAIPPDAAGDTITEENPLPYWTWTPTAKITAAIITDATAGSGNVFQVSCAAASTGETASLTRFISVAASADRARTYVPLFRLGATTGSAPTVTVRCRYFRQDQTTAVGTEFSKQEVASAITLIPDDLPNATVPSDAAYLKITIQFTGKTLAGTAILQEVRVISGDSYIFLTEDTPTSSGPGRIRMQSTGVRRFVFNSGIEALSTSSSFGETLVNSLSSTDTITSGGLFTANANATVSGDLTVVGDIGFDGVIYGTSALTGPNINLGGTNARLWTHSTTAADVAASTSSTTSGVLITKATAGQPSTNINGTATTDAFADALRNGGIAVDTTNNRAYFYSGGWKYAALTTPSDSRLKDEITEISGALDTLRQLMPVAFKWKRPEAHGRSEAVSDDGTRLGFIADQVATTDLAHWVETLGVDEREADLVDTTEVLAVNIPQNEMEALVVQALLDIDARLKALEAR